MAHANAQSILDMHLDPNAGGPDFRTRPAWAERRGITPALLTVLTEVCVRASTRPAAPAFALTILQVEARRLVAKRPHAARTYTLLDVAALVLAGFADRANAVQTHDAWAEVLDPRACIAAGLTLDEVLAAGDEVDPTHLAALTALRGPAWLDLAWTRRRDRAAEWATLLGA